MNSATIISPERTAPSVSGFLTTQSASARFWGGLAAALALVGIIGGGTLLVIRHVVRAQLASSLQAVLKSEESAVRNWLDLRTRSLQLIVDNPGIAEPAVAILAAGKPASQDDPAALQLRTTLAKMMQALKVDEWRLADPLGGIVMSSEGAGVVRVATPLLDPLAEACAQKHAVFVPPTLLEGQSLPRLAIIVPFQAAGDSVQGALVARIDPRNEFSRILIDGRLGDTGETYAFDMNGRMISESRHIEQLKANGLLPKDAETTVLTVYLRRADGAAPGTNPETLPMTAMAAQAVQGRDGLDLDGYIDFRGVASVAAWTVLKDLNIAVVTKQDSAEAYLPLRVLWGVFLGVIALLAVATLVAAVTMRRNYSAMRKLVRAEAQVEALGQYQLEKKLGQGGMGIVYRARHAMLRRPTAVKVMQNPGDQSQVARFEREVQLTCSLTHPNTISVFDYGHSADGQLYYAMEYLDGWSLDDLIRGFGPVPPARAVYILAQVAGALHEAHLKGLIHRDIKPANIYLCTKGGVCDFVKVLDFGLAKPFKNDRGNVTTGNLIAGTPAYMCPEIINQESAIDGRSDLYALGCVAYELLTGIVPFLSPTFVGLMQCHVQKIPAPPSAVITVPGDLEAIVMQCLAKKPEDRPADAAALRRSLLACACAKDWDETLAETWWKTNFPAENTANAETVVTQTPPDLRTSLLPPGHGALK